MVDLIEKKRDNKEHSYEEIQFIINQYMQNKIPDYQISAWAMAIYFNSMSELELTYLTEALVASGEQLDLSDINGIKVDKHSTGGVGDTTTLIVAPLVASLGVPVAKMSGRGLGYTGGTVDKLNSIPGFNTDLSMSNFIHLVNQQKLAIIGQTKNLTPADKKLYSLRDVTATVDSIPLIASSIMSKKIAAGADCLILDVKLGSGAFMKTLDSAENLASTMVKIGKNHNKKTMAIISNMDEPLGYMIGNALEVKEAIETLKGNGPKDLEELSLVLASYMVYFANKATSVKQAQVMLRETISSGKAIETFKTFIASQGGNSTVVDNVSLLPKARYQIPVYSKEEGFVSAISAHQIGTIAMLLGAGRTTKTSVIDPAVGIELRKKVGEHVKKNEPLAFLHINDNKPSNIISQVESSFTISTEKQEPNRLIYKTIF
ncbi:pyrimidine-nucleoside phosphorylase [Pueribacillus sp. YX66]|uniref:pyrimidine-nucleoside phosphorylase n=1 Tax=Pueribacillus sp. YX66 TaxID=3229242 RepID=UPI00358D5AB3